MVVGVVQLSLVTVGNIAGGGGGGGGGGVHSLSLCDQIE